MALDNYLRKRNFAKTPEPQGRVRRGDGRRGFVVQKHKATRLHYDFRLEIPGVLVSWAVPKGPSINPADKRLAVRTEDHPIEYGNFEGEIPEGQYGAGTVMVWDRGSYETQGEGGPAEQLARGKINVVLNGKKLRGGFTLIRAGKRSGAAKDSRRWLMMKHRDANSASSWDIENPELDYSVLTGRTLKQIEQGARVEHREKPSLR